MENPKQSKKMAEVEEKIRTKLNEKVKLGDRYTRLSNYVPATELGKKAQQEGCAQLNASIQNLEDEIKKLRQEHDVATVQFVGGFDTEVYEPTPNDALRQAS